MIGRHPDSALLVEYASGSLELAPSIAITTHIQFCDQCRRTVESLQAVGGEMLEEAASVPMTCWTMFLRTSIATVHKSSL